MALGSTTPAAAGQKRRRLPRALRIFAAGIAVAVAGVGFLHTKAGRPLLAALGVGCPAMRVSPAEVEGLRQRALSSLRGSLPASARPVFGLTLDGSTETEVRSWTAARGLDCQLAARPTRHLTCRDVPATALRRAAEEPAVDEVSFTFYPDGRLLGVETLRRALTGGDAARIFTAITSALDAEVGSSTERAGTPSADYLAGGAMHTAFARYRYSNFLATVTAMNLSGRIALREQYASAVTPG
jgi:hypothetical protein